MKIRKKWILLVILILVAVTSLALFSKKHKKMKPATAKSATLQTYTVKKGMISNTLEVTGEIQPISVVQIKSKVSGKILRFYVDENQFVKQGDVIADIEPDYNQASTISSVRSNLKLSEIRLKNALKDFNDKQSLLKSHYISQKDADAAKDELESAQLSFKQASEQYALVKEIDSNGEVAHIVAPASGTVIQRSIEVGEMVVGSNSSFGEGTVVMKLANLDKMVVKSNINEVDIDKFRTGQLASIKVDAFPYQDYQGKVTKIAAMAILDNNAKVFPIEIQLSTVDKKLRPGMTANVTINGETRKDVLVVPIRAIFSDDRGQDIVYLVKANAISDSVNVKTGINDYENVEIVTGLKEGQVISLTEKNAQKEVQMRMQGGF